MIDICYNYKIWKLYSEPNCKNYALNEIGYPYLMASISGN